MHTSNHHLVWKLGLLPPKRYHVSYHCQNLGLPKKSEPSLWSTTAERSSHIYIVGNRCCLTAYQSDSDPVVKGAVRVNYTVIVWTYHEIKIVSQIFSLSNWMKGFCLTHTHSLSLSLFCCCCHLKKSRFQNQSFPVGISVHFLPSDDTEEIFISVLRTNVFCFPGGRQFHAKPQAPQWQTCYVVASYVL